MKHVFLFLFSLCVTCVNAQLTFQKAIGGTWADNNECLNRTTGAICTVSGSGYGICHTTQCFGPAQNTTMPSPYFIRLDQNGDTICTQTYSTTSNSYGRSIHHLNEGSGFIMGVHWGGTGLNCSGLIRTNDFGDTLWARAFVPTTGYSMGYFGMPVHDGFVACGQYQVNKEGGLLAKVDNAGNMVFGKSYVPTLQMNGMFFYSSCETSDHCILATGSYHNNTAVAGIVIMKADSNGNVMWVKSYEGTDYQNGYSIMELPDHSIMVAGNRISGGFGNYDAFVLKTDPAGNPIFQKIYGDTTYEWVNSMVLRDDGTIVLCGYAYPANCGNAILICIDQNGVIQWTRRYGASDDVGNSLTNADDGGIVFTGFSYSFGAGNSDIWVVKTDANGMTSCYTNPLQYMEDTIGVTAVSRTVNTQTSVTCISPHCTSRSGGIVTTICTTVDVADAQQPHQFFVYPNPAENSCRIIMREDGPAEISVLSVRGQEVIRTRTVFRRNEEWALDVSGLAPGLYTIVINAGEGFYMQKLLIE